MEKVSFWGLWVVVNKKQSKVVCRFRCPRLLCSVNPTDQISNQEIEELKLLGNIKRTIDRNK